MKERWPAWGWLFEPIYPGTRAIEPGAAGPAGSNERNSSHSIAALHAEAFRRVWTALLWQGFSSACCSTGRCGRVFDLLVRRSWPLAIMPSAKTGPDRKHALEAHRRKWVFLSSGFDRLSHYFMSALPNSFDRGVAARPYLYAATGSR